MPSKTYFQGAPHIVLAPAITRCPLCENKLHVRKTMTRGLKGKSAVFKVTVKELYCTNTHCKLYQVPVKPEGLSFFYLPHMVHGTDVVFFVGERRLKNWQYKQIREILDVKPSISSLSRFFHLFEKIAKCFLEAQEEETKAIIKKQGGYILMADATEHRESKPTYHIVDALSGRLLAAEQLEKNDYHHIKPIWEYVKEKYGTPLAILSDDDTAQRKVRLELFPETKWIYCQYHFLRNLGEKLLQKLYNTLTEKVKELGRKIEDEVRSLERKLETGVSREKYREFSSGVRAVLKPRGKFPFELGWLEVYDAIKTLFKTILGIRVEGRVMSHLKIFVVKNAQKLKSLSEKAEKLRELNTHFVKLRKVLGTAKNAEDAEKKLNALAAEMEGKAKVISERINKYIDSLIAAYTIKGAPRTIVDVEQFHKEVKSPVRLGNRLAFEAHGAGLSYAREVAKRGQLEEMQRSVPALIERLEEKKGEEVVAKKEKKKSRSYERRYRELWREDPEAYAARMAQLIKEIDDLETGKAEKPPPSEGDKKPRKESEA